MPLFKIYLTPNYFMRDFRHRLAFWENAALGTKGFWILVEGDFNANALEYALPHPDPRELTSKLRLYLLRNETLLKHPVRNWKVKETLPGCAEP